jgi:hypothetical protein
MVFACGAVEPLAEPEADPLADEELEDLLDPDDEHPARITGTSNAPTTAVGTRQRLTNVRVLIIENLSDRGQHKRGNNPTSLSGLSTEAGREH